MVAISLVEDLSPAEEYKNIRKVTRSIEEEGGGHTKMREI